MILYAGLSLDADSAKKLLPDVEMRPPAKRKDIYKDFEQGHRLFMVADGEFEQNLAISPGEIMDILRAGGLVFGSSSMGALRAVELREYGMFGVGEIYEMILSSPCFKDDWLGHIYNPLTLEMTTLPFVEVLFLLRPYVREDIERVGVKLQRRLSLRWNSLDRQKCYDIVDELKLARVKDLRKSIDELFVGKRKGQKRVDAIAMLTRATRHLRDVRTFNAKLAK